MLDNNQGFYKNVFGLSCFLVVHSEDNRTDHKHSQEIKSKKRRYIIPGASYAQSVHYQLTSSVKYHLPGLAAQRHYNYLGIANS